MPTRQRPLKKKEQSDYEATCSQLEKLGIEAKCNRIPDPKQRCFSLEPIYEEFARAHDLPDGSVAVTLPAKLTVLKSGVMFNDALVLPQWDDASLDLEEPQEHRHFAEFIRDFPRFEPTVLNKFLVGRQLPLRPCQLEGLIIAIGWSHVPAVYQDEKRVSFKVCLTDRQEAEVRCNFIARVDRRLKLRYESQRPDPKQVAEALRKRVPLFDREKAESSVHGEAAHWAKPEAENRLGLRLKRRGTIQ